MSQTELAPDGKPFNLITLVNRQGTTATFCDWGATWFSCRIKVKHLFREVLLGCHSAQQYLAQQAYLGATIGRYANRIAQAKLDYQQKQYILSANQAPHLLHGGVMGLDKRRWHIQEQHAHKVIFTIFSSDGDEGFPGNLSVKACYELDDNNQMHIDFTATTDQATPVNLTNHAYFNLDGNVDSPNSDIKHHTLHVNADYYLPVDKDGIPLGSLITVEHDDMDLRHARKVGKNLLTSVSRQLAGGYDHAYLLKQDGQMIASLVSTDNLLALHVFTSKPALQVYTGNFLAGTPNRVGGYYQNYAGIALETQFLPDSPHHLDWPQPSCWLLPGETYRHHTIYQFDC